MNILRLQKKKLKLLNVQSKYYNNFVLYYEHKNSDYKISAVNYYLNNKDNIRKTCKIFDCSKTSLQR